MGSKVLSLVACFLVVLSCSCNSCYGSARKLTALYKPPPMVLKYHNGKLLEGNLPVSILWYGKFTPTQKSIVSDFFLSLNPSSKNHLQHSSKATTNPSVSHWWENVQTYMKNAQKKQTHIILSKQTTDEKYSLGKSLTRSQISELSQRVNSKPGTITLVLTDKDVTVEGFCMSSCGFHGSNKMKNSAYIWVGNSVTQCAGQCAWPFHQPIYGPQDKPLVAPNGDVGVDGMIINIASLLSGTVTNPFGNGYFQGTADAPLEASSSCPGIYGKGAYPGYAGNLLRDTATGGSYNALGVNGRKYLLPALFNPTTFECSTLV
ncbi:hypothetical protein MKW92_010417 [Papaver armeniacum]|nr:hypothetical protein MKW92_010417 [Papaver armeniacum]